jgi:hypothetical protein
MYRSAWATSFMTLLACIAAGCSGGSYHPEVAPDREVDHRVSGFLQQFEGVWSGSSWETAILVYDKGDLVAYLPDNPTGSIVVFEPLGMVDPEKRAVSVTLIRQHAPNADCTSEYATKLVNQLPKDYVRKAAAFVALNEDGLERWMSEQPNKFYELIPTSNPSGAAVTGEPDLRRAIQQLELYENLCDITAEATEVATLKNDSQAAGIIKPLLIDDSGGNQYFKFVRKVSDDDKKIVREKYAKSAENGPSTESTAAVSIADAKLSDLNKLLNTINQKNADVILWLHSYKETCLKNHPPGSGRTAEMLRGAGDIAGFDWRPAADIVDLCSGKRPSTADTRRLTH